MILRVSRIKFKINQHIEKQEKSQLAQKKKTNTNSEMVQMLKLSDKCFKEVLQKYSKK